MAITDYPDWVQQQRDILEKERAEVERRRRENLISLRQMMDAGMIANEPPSPPNPRVRQIQQLTDDNQRRKRQMSAIITAIERDLIAVRSLCKDCDCGELPKATCPNNTMSKTMTALVHITMENMGE